MTVTTDDTNARTLEYATDKTRWAAMQRRDSGADGIFFYSVRTTGAYCRPGCAARPARRENVGFHSTLKESEAAGFRACKRCRPNGPARTKHKPERLRRESPS